MEREDANHLVLYFCNQILPGGTGVNRAHVSQLLSTVPTKGDMYERWVPYRRHGRLVNLISPMTLQVQHYFALWYAGKCVQLLEIWDRGRSEGNGNSELQSRRLSAKN